MPHLIDHDAALHFIKHYQRLLQEVIAHPSFPKPTAGNVNAFHLLLQARNWMQEHPEVLPDTLATLRKAKAPLPEDVEQAVHSLRAQRWVYLRDTAHYSIFLPLTADTQPQAYAVKSLTTRLRDMTGCSGMVLQTGLMEYAGAIVTDGLIAPEVYLGPGYRESYGEYLAAARKQGQFYQKQLPAQPVVQTQPEAARPAPKSSPARKTKKKS